MKRYRLVQGALEIIDPDFDTTTFVNFDGRMFRYSVLDYEGTQIQFGDHENLSDLETMTGLDTNDIDIIENVFLGGE